MKLILIRHAKSAWDDPYADDHDRRLTERGIRSARAIAEWLTAQGHVPGHVYASDAARTQQTAQLLLAGLSPAPLLSLHPSLYHATPEGIAQLIRRAPQERLAIVGHNPGLGLLARGLVATPPDHPRFDDYPTAATCVIEVAPALEPRSGRCLDFVVPRDLTD